MLDDLGSGGGHSGAMVQRMPTNGAVTPHGGGMNMNQQFSSSSSMQQSYSYSSSSTTQQQQQQQVGGTMSHCHTVTSQS